MVTDSYLVDIDFELVSQWTSEPPKVTVRLDQQTVWCGLLSTPQSFSLKESLAQGVHCLEIELSDKSDLDPVQSVQIAELAIGKIHSQRFFWQAVYRPRYPEPWASQQQAQGLVLQPELPGTYYLGWNGIWKLQLDVPVFTWIHQVENLGWIYD